MRTRVIVGLAIVGILVAIFVSIEFHAREQSTEKIEATTSPADNNDALASDAKADAQKQRQDLINSPFKPDRPSAPPFSPLASANPNDSIAQKEIYQTALTAIDAHDMAGYEKAEKDLQNYPGLRELREYHAARAAYDEVFANDKRPMQSDFSHAPATTQSSPKN